MSALRHRLSLMIYSVLGLEPTRQEAKGKRLTARPPLPCVYSYSFHLGIYVYDILSVLVAPVGWYARRI